MYVDFFPRSIRTRTIMSRMATIIGIGICLLLLTPQALGQMAEPQPPAPGAGTSVGISAAAATPQSSPQDFVPGMNAGMSTDMTAPDIMMEAESFTLGLDPTDTSSPTIAPADLVLPKSVESYLEIGEIGQSLENEFADAGPVEFTSMAEHAELISEAPDDAVIDASTIRATADSDDVHYVVSFGMGNSLAMVVGDWLGPRFKKVLGPSVPPTGDRMFYYGAHSVRDYEMLQVGQRSRRKPFHLEADPSFPPVYSPDGKYLFAWVIPGKNMRLQVNSETEPIFGKPSPESFVMSPDGRQWAYAVQDSTNGGPGIGGGNGGMVVRNGKAGLAYNMISTPMSFSPNSQHFAHVAATIHGWVAVINDKPGPQYSQISPPIVFSPDSQHFAYSARREDGVWVVVLDHKEVPGTEALRHGGIEFSPNSAHLAAYLKKGNTWSLTIDGQIHPAYDAIGKGSLIFSKDGTRHAYAAMRDGQWYAVLDGKELDANEALLAGSFRFSPDSRRFVYVAKHNGYWRAVLDGLAHAPFQSIDAASVQFSHDSRRLAYVGKLEGLPRVVVDRQEKTPALDIVQLTFSPDGHHLAWLAEMPEGWMLQVDDIPGQYRYASPIPNAKIVFDSDTQLHTVVAFPQEGRFFRIDATMNATGIAIAE